MQVSNVRSPKTDLVLQAFAEGMKVADIAEKYEITRHNVSSLVHTHGVRRGDIVEMTSKPNAKVEPEIRAPVAEVKRLAAKGLTIEKIGALLRCPYAAVAEALAR
jgi:uncharacterized protein YjcR